jgi:hypothetical protein
MGRPRKDGTPARTPVKNSDEVDLVKVRDIVYQMHEELRRPSDEYDYMGHGDSRKCGYMEVKVDTLMALLRMI